MSREKILQGEWGQRLAVKYLDRRGFQVVEENWRGARSEKGGEVDLVAYDRRGRDWWVVEVKCHESGPWSLLSRAQARRLRRSAQALAACGCGFVRCGLLWIEPGHPPKVEFLENPW